jgi:aminoglycoside phosphotransferase (APT) family kinase protein
MRKGRALGDREQAVAAFVASELGCEATRVVRVDAFATNAVYAVDADGRRFVVKASMLHEALRAEAWACARGADAGCAAPAILGLGRLGTDDRMSAFIMRRVAGGPIVAGHPALPEVGVGLRRVHDVRLQGFGWLAEASWDKRGAFSLLHSSWLGFLQGICGDARRLADRYVVAAPVAEAAAAAIDAHADALAAVEVGSLCHGDLKAAHILVDAGRLAGVIDWGDAVVGDPLWDIARFAHRADGGAVSWLLEGYDPERALVDELAWRVPLYGALWMLVDAIVVHRLGRRVEAVLEAAMGSLAQQAG